MAIIATFTKSRETKGTVVFKEDGPEDQHKVGSLYIQKRAISDLPDGTEQVVVRIDVPS